MKKRLLRLILWATCISVVFCSIGCSVRLADLSMISTKGVTLDKVDIDRLPQKRSVVGKDRYFIFLFFPIPFKQLRLETAVDDALEKGNGDMLIDCVITHKFWYFLIGQQTLEVKGTVVNTRGN